MIFVRGGGVRPHYYYWFLTEGGLKHNDSSLCVNDSVIDHRLLGGTAHC